jgi:hypothetical protein
MKSLLFAVATASAVCAFALESSNVVGYQNKDVGAFSLSTATFTQVDGGENFTFADYKVNCDEEDPDATTGWIANADSFNTFTASGSFDKSYVYCPAWLAEALTEEFEYTVTPGWYSTADEEFKNNCNTESIPFGKGTLAKSSGVGSQITFSGAVKATATVTDVGAFTITGNSSPSKITFGDLVVNCDEEDPDATTGWIANADTINTFTASGSFDKAYIYCPAWLAEALSEEFGYEVTAGWYATTDEEFKNNCNALELGAGEAVIMKSAAVGTTVSVKSAL